MTQDTHAAADDLEQRLRAAGHRVTIDGSTDDAGMAALLTITTRALRARVAEGREHPPFHDLGTADRPRRWWPLDEFARWRGERRTPGTPPEERGSLNLEIRRAGAET
jgi:hypothetical protein